jgi:hypothetical protein
MCQNLDFRFLFLLPFYQVFFRSFSFFDLVFYYLFSFFDLVFYYLLFFLFFRSCFVPIFLARVVLSLTYPNLFENKMLGCCCFLFTSSWNYQMCPVHFVASDSLISEAIFHLYWINAIYLISYIINLSIEVM